MWILIVFVFCYSWIMFNEEMLPTVLRHSEIALLLDDEIRVLDRRAYPLKKVYVRVRNEEDCYNAIKDMVTQGGGPLELALRCMVLLSRKDKNLKKCAAKARRHFRNGWMRRRIAYAKRFAPS